MAEYRARARYADNLAEWTPSATPSHRAPGSGRPSWPGASVSSRRSKWCWSGSRGGDPNAASCSPGCAGSARPCCSGSCARWPCGTSGAPGKIEARPDAELRRPLSAALHRAIRDLAVRHRAPDRVEEVLGVLKAFALRANKADAKLRDRWQPGIDVPAAQGRADSGDIEIDLVELFTDVAELAADVGTGVALLIDEIQDLQPDDVSALCAACHELSQSGAPLVVVGAGLPHVPAVLSASQVLLRAALPLRADRPARPRGRRLRGDGADRARGRRDRAAKRSTRSSTRPAATLLHPGLRQGGLGRGAVRPDHGQGRPGRGARGGGGAGGRLLRFALRARDAGRARVPAGDGRADRRAATNPQAPPTSPCSSGGSRPRCRRPATA